MLSTPLVPLLFFFLELEWSNRKSEYPAGERKNESTTLERSEGFLFRLCFCSFVLSSSGRSLPGVGVKGVSVEKGFAESVGERGVNGEV